MMFVLRMVTRPVTIAARESTRWPEVGMVWAVLDVREVDDAEVATLLRPSIDLTDRNLWFRCGQRDGDLLRLTAVAVALPWAD